MFFKEKQKYGHGIFLSGLYVRLMQNNCMLNKCYSNKQYFLTTSP